MDTSKPTIQHSAISGAPVLYSALHRFKSVLQNLSPVSFELKIRSGGGPVVLEMYFIPLIWLSFDCSRCYKATFGMQKKKLYLTDLYLVHNKKRGL